MLEPVIGLDIWRGNGRLLLPPGVDDGLLARLGQLVRRGHALPTKVLHSLEALGSVVRGADLVHPVHGAVGCSPAATAAWLWDRGGCPAAVGYLEAVQSRGGGPVPGVTPITVFERTWVLAALTAVGIDVMVPQDWWAACTLSLVSVVSVPVPVFRRILTTRLLPCTRWRSWVAPVRWIVCWLIRWTDISVVSPTNGTPSVSANAHVLQTLGRYLEYDLSGRFRCQTVMGRLSGWLRDCQEADGSWWDKWHASPYYATVGCATALHCYSRSASAFSVSKAVEWLLDSQREDGSWGRWNGTYEETAYAVQTLLQTHVPRADSAVEQAAARGCVFLQRSVETISTRRCGTARTCTHQSGLYKPKG